VAQSASVTKPCAAPPFDTLAWLSACRETWLAGLVPAQARQLREQRLAALLAHAGAESPFYRARRHGPQLTDFAPVDKATLMRHFDDWSCDRRITRAAAAVFIADKSCIAQAWLGEYLVWTSSGTSGVPGWFVQDARSLAAYDAIDALRLRGGSMQSGLGAWGLGQRFAFVGATSGHFAGFVSMKRLQALHAALPQAWQPQVHILSAEQPLCAIAEALQGLQPSVLITYPSCAAALAPWQQAGTLGLRLRELWLGGEQLSPEQRRQVREAFACPVRNNYGASEFFTIASECVHGRLHVNDDWLILEPVDARDRPVPDGTLSHAALLTHLANRTQPLIRYRLDDRIRRITAPCPCGSAFAAIEVQGRSADTLTLKGAHRRAVTILPLALETAIEEAAHVTQFQIIGQPGGDLELRLEPEVPNARAAAVRCRDAIDAFLLCHGAPGTRVRYSTAAPVHGRASGKLRRVIGAPPER
jgi:phenylacetate-CoA ligase